MSRAGVAFGAVVAVIAVAAAPAAVGNAQAIPELAEGNWEGYLGMDNASSYQSDGAAAFATTYQALGYFEAASIAGTLSGRWLIDVHTELETDGVIAEADATGVGVFRGSARGPTLEFGKLTVTEPTVGMTLTFTAGELPAATGGFMTVVGSDCNSAWGDWSVEFPGNTLEGQFTAFRVGSDGDDDESVAAARRASQEALTSRGRVVLSNVRDGYIDLETIRDLLRSAEGALDGGGTGPCGSESNRSFRTATTELIDSMLFEMAGITDRLDADVLIELVIAGFRSGSFATDPEARAFWLQVYDEAVDAALTDGDPVALAKFSAASRLLGFDDQADTIDDLLAELGA